MRFLLFATSLFMLALASFASASSLTYQYQGLPFGYGAPWQACPATWHDYPVPDPCPAEPFKGSLTIDQSAFPGGTVAGASFRLSIWERNDDWLPCTPVYPSFGEFCYIYEIKGADGTVMTGHGEQGWDAFDFFSFDGFVDEFIGFTVYFGDFEWQFDAAGNVASWMGGNYCGGSCDPFSWGRTDGRGSDSYPLSGAETQGQGSWTLVPPVSEVPLPATALTLASGLGLFAVAAIRGRQRRA